MVRDGGDISNDEDGGADDDEDGGDDVDDDCGGIDIAGGIDSDTDDDDDIGNDIRRFLLSPFPPPIAPPLPLLLSAITVFLSL